MEISTLRKRLLNYSYFIPVRVHLVILLVALFLGAGWIQRNNALPQTARTAIINIFIIVTFWFALSILIFSFITSFLPWVIFVWRTSNSKGNMKISTPGNPEGNTQKLHVDIYPILKPLFGYLRLRFILSEDNLSPKFSPISHETRRTLFPIHLKGWYNWPLTNIKEYDLRGSIVYFEDFFQFFSFAAQVSAAGNFFTHPFERSVPPVVVQPKKTEDIQIRIEQLRKVEGEFLNYKNFETNDDVRRIVWKIYARNKELVVRIPENLDPYSSHIYFYASFYDNISSDLYEELNAIFLDQFKTVIWNVYEQLYRQNNGIQFIVDQETKATYADDPLGKTRYRISTAHWQKDHNLTSYFESRYGSVLCVSSFSDVAQMSEILEHSGRSLLVIFVLLSKSFKNTRPADYLQWIFIKPARKSSDKLRLNFMVSPLRNKILENEKKMLELLNHSECEFLVIDADITS